MEVEPGVAEFRLRPLSFLFPRGILGLLMLLALAWILIEGETGPILTVCYVLMVAGNLALPIINYVSARREPVAIRLTTDGVEFPAAKAERRWSEIVAVRLRSQKGTRRWKPGLLLVGPRELEFARRSNTPPPGWPVDTLHLDTDREDVLAAILRYKDLPVYRD